MHEGPSRMERDEDVLEKLPFLGNVRAYTGSECRCHRCQQLDGHSEGADPKLELQALD
jgi:hypothetical protein